MILDYEGHSPQIHPEAFVHPGAWVIGNVILGAGASVWPGAVLRGDVERITVGAETNIQDGSVVHTEFGKPVVLEENVSVGHLVMLHGCTIKARSLIGNNSTVLDDAVVEEGAVVGAGSVVPPRGRVERGTVVMGIPAKKVRTVRPEEASHLFDNTKTYLELAKRHRRSLDHAGPRER